MDITLLLIGTAIGIAVWSFIFTVVLRLVRKWKAKGSMPRWIKRGFPSKLWNASPEETFDMAFQAVKRVTIAIVIIFLILFVVVAIVAIITG